MDLNMLYVGLVRYEIGIQVKHFYIPVKLVPILQLEVALDLASGGYVKSLNGVLTVSEYKLNNVHQRRQSQKNTTQRRIQ